MVRLQELRWRGQGAWHFTPGDYTITVTTGAGDPPQTRAIRIEGI
jgi:hypothetical protein